MERSSVERSTVERPTVERSTVERSTVERSTPDPARMHALTTAPPNPASQVGLHPGPGNGSGTGRWDHPSLTGVSADGSAGGGNIRHAGVTTRATGTTQTTTGPGERASIAHSTA